MGSSFTSFIERARAAAATLPTLALSGAVALAIGACSDGGTTTGPPGDDSDGSGSDGEVTFYVGGAAQASASMSPRVRASVSGARPPVDPEQIASLEIVVSTIEAHRAGGSGSATTTPAWVGIDLDPPVVIDPAVLGAGQFEAMAEGDLPPGDYDNVRLIPESITVQFQTSSSTTPIVVGNHEYAPAPATHDVELPSGSIKIPTAHFTVDDNGGILVIMWDADATAASINATGSGMILMRPTFVEGPSSVEAELEGGG